MSNKNKNINSVVLNEENFFSGGVISWENSKSQIWDEIFAEKVNQDVKTPKFFSLNKIVKYSVAATVIAVIGLSLFFIFYSKTEVCPVGEHITVSLPDGSFVEMNAGSELTYFPYRWKASRDLNFEGEGFFEVEKGKRFQVRSTLGKTVVLGTSFNVFSRDDTYRISCVSGKVRVMGKNKESVILNPNEQVLIKAGTELQKSEILKKEDITSWRFNQFYYSGEPLKDVVKEIERQFGIDILMNEDIDIPYSGNFNKANDVEVVLSWICKPLELKFEKISEDQYRIIRNN